MQFSLVFKGSRLVIGILMSIALFLPQLNFASHNPVASIDTNMERHSFLGSEASDGSLHIHENGTLEEANQFHQHGHNNADHTHLSINLCSENIPLQQRHSIGCSGYERDHLSPPLAHLQRPPKSYHFS